MERQQLQPPVGNWDPPTGLRPSTRRRLTLPPWLSWPVAVFAAPLVLIVLRLLATEPLPTILPVVPAIAVAVCLSWMNAIDMGTRAARAHAVLWGMTVAAVIAGVVNTTVWYIVSERIAAQVSAPIIEELLKAAGVLWALRRREIRNGLDGLVCAGLVAVGFAFAENIGYFLEANQNGMLAQSFLARGVLTPFAHPLFSMWSGLAIGLGVYRRGRLRITDLWGVLVSIGLHAGFNTLALHGAALEPGWIAVVYGCGALMFTCSVLALYRTRANDMRMYRREIARVAFTYQLNPYEVEVFKDWSRVRRHRRSLRRRERKQFDKLHATVRVLMADRTPSPPATQDHLGHLGAARRAAQSSRRR